MSAYLVRPRSSIADPELARAATVDLPSGFQRPNVPEALIDAVEALRARNSEPDLPIVLSLAPVVVRSRS
jgi:hypothetical protein